LVKKWLRKVMRKILQIVQNFIIMIINQNHQASLIVEIVFQQHLYHFLLHPKQHFA
jgi:hypothetical protein